MCPLLWVFGGFEHAVFARLYSRIVDYLFRSREPEPEEFAYCRRSAGHSVLKPKIVDCRKLLGRKHNLQAFFPG
jgi:hypothetical protein